MENRNSPQILGPETAPAAPRAHAFSTPDEPPETTTTKPDNDPIDYSVRPEHPERRPSRGGTRG